MYHNLLSGGAYLYNPGIEDAYGSDGFSYFGFYDNAISTFVDPNGGYYGLDFGGVFSSGNLTAKDVNDFECGDVWSDGSFAGSGSDASPWYPTAATAVAACPNF